MVRLYHRPMKFTFQLFKEDSDLRTVEPFLFPLTLDLSSVAEARSMIRKVADNAKVPAHSLTIRSEDGSISERWFRIDGSWRRRDT
jgi:hypothetical protein